MRISVAAVLLSVLFVAMSSPVNGQNYLYATGSPRWATSIPIENGVINVSNGEVHLELSLASQPQRGSLPLNEKLVYDSRIWEIVQSGSNLSWQPTNVPDSQAGWRFVSGYPQASTVVDGGSNTTAPCPNNGTQFFTYHTYALTWADGAGTSHVFPVGTVQMMQSSCNWTGLQTPDQPTGKAYAEDESGYYMTVTQYNVAVVYDNRGNQVYPSLQDPNGNSFSLDTNGNLVDTLGRTPVVKTVNGSTTYYDVLSISGNSKRYTVTTETLNVNTYFTESAVTEYSGPLTAIQSIGLPDGTSYSFTYDSSGGVGRYGELTSITLPTQGVVTLGYQNYVDSYQNNNRWLRSYTGGHGSYTFAPSVVTQCSGSTPTGCQESVTVTNGNSNQVVYLLTLNNGAWNTKMDYYTSQATSPIVTTSTANDYSTNCASWDTQCVGSMDIRTMSTTTTLDDTGQKAQTVFTYANANSDQPQKVQEWDYFTGTPSATPTRETDLAYDYLVNGASLLTQREVLDSLGTPAALTKYAYDGGSSGTPRGNLTSVTSGLGSSPVTTRSTYDSYGMKSSDVDGLLNTTSYSYDCSDAYLQTVSARVSASGALISTTTNHDCSTGFPTSVVDPNKNQTTYTYYASGANVGRLQSVGSPDGGATTYSYPSALETDRTVAQATGAGVTSHSLIDTFGRPSQEVKLAPEGAISSETSYDTTAGKLCITTPHLVGSSPTDGSTCTYYDVLGRISYTSFPDGNTVINNYSGATKLVYDELRNEKKYAYDAFQRLVTVWEPDAAGALNYETDYQYNALDKITQIDQWGSTAHSSSTDRQRVFLYDSLGQMIAENTPENASAAAPAQLTVAGSSAKWTNTYVYDPNGNLQTSTDNRGLSITNKYDELNRITLSTPSDGSRKSAFGYDGFDENGNIMAPAVTNAMGRLSHTSDEVNTAANYSYDTVGRLVTQSYCLPQNCTYSITASAAYDLAGHMTSMTYPDSRMVSQTFDGAGRLWSVNYQQWGGTTINSPYFTATAYVPPGQLTGATLGNGTLLSSTYSNRQSLTSTAYSSSGTALWGRQFGWDKNARNLTLVTDSITGSSRQFGYDHLNRLAYAQDVSTAGTAATAVISFSGTEQSLTFNTCPGAPYGPCYATAYDNGSITVAVNGVTATVDYGQGWDSGSLATSLAQAINADSSQLVTASASGSDVTLTSKILGPSGDYPISITSQHSTQTFSSPSFSASGPSSLSGGVNASSGALNEQYSYDPWGNLQQSGNWTFNAQVAQNNQLSAYSYDAAGNETDDQLGHSYAFTATGMLASSAGYSYTYDTDGNRVEKAGAATTDTVYFGGMPIATLSGGSWTDIIYAGGGAIAEVAGTQSALPTYRVTDQVGSVQASLDNVGNLSGGVDFAPYGQQFSGSTPDPLQFTSLPYDTENGTTHATFRQYLPNQGRWISPDPYSGSMDLSNPQSLNRYSYVGSMPLNARDPSGLDGQNPISIAGGLQGCVGAAASGGGNVLADIGCGVSLISDIAGLVGQPTFHGSLTPRPSTGNSQWDGNFGESLGLPVDGPPLGGGGIGGFFGLPSGCEFGACGGSFTSPQDVITSNGANDNFTAYHCGLFGPCYSNPRNGNPRRYFGSRWCGPGGGGSPVSGVDRACMAHDICFGNAGIDASVNTNSSIHLTLQQAAAASGCNQTLYNAVSQHSGDAGASRVMFWLKYGSFIGILAPGTGVQ